MVNSTTIIPQIKQVRQYLSKMWTRSKNDLNLREVIVFLFPPRSNLVAKQSYLNFEVSIVIENKSSLF